MAWERATVCKMDRVANPIATRCVGWKRATVKIWEWKHSVGTAFREAVRATVWKILSHFTLTRRTSGPSARSSVRMSVYPESAPFVLERWEFWARE